MKGAERRRTAACRSRAGRGRRTSRRSGGSAASPSSRASRIARVPTSRGSPAGFIVAIHGVGAALQQQLVDAGPSRSCLDPPQADALTLADVRDAARNWGSPAPPAVLYSSLVRQATRSPVSSRSSSMGRPPSTSSEPSAHDYQRRVVMRLAGGEAADRSPSRSSEIAHQALMSPYSSTTSACECCSSRRISTSFIAWVGLGHEQPLAQVGEQVGLHRGPVRRAASSPRGCTSTSLPR